MADDLLTVQEVADLLKVKKNTVYEMLKRGDLPSFKFGKQIRIRHEDIENRTETATSGSLVPRSAHSESPSASGAQPLILCGQDQSLDFIAHDLTLTAGMPQILRSHQGSYNALVDLYNGRAHIATCHLWDEKTNTYNLPYIEKLLPGTPCIVVRLFGRSVGFYTQPGNPKGINGWSDLLRDDVTMVNRELGSGIRVLLDEKLRKMKASPARVIGYTNVHNNHTSVAVAVASGKGDVGLGIKAPAKQVQGIEFIPIQQEWYDMVILANQKSEIPFRVLLDYVSSERFLLELSQIGEYDLSQTGRMFRI